MGEHLQKLKALIEGYRFEEFPFLELCLRCFLLVWVRLPGGVAFLRKIAETLVRTKAGRALVKRTAFRVFCGGETAEEMAMVAQRFTSRGLCVIVNLAVEALDNEQQIEQVTQRQLSLLRECARFLPEGTLIALECKPTTFAVAELLASYCEKVAESEPWQKALWRVLRVAEACRALGVPLLIDAEESWLQKGVDALFWAAAEQFNTANKAWVYNTYQMYRREALTELKTHIEQAINKKIKLGVKLVRGAYLEAERNAARRKGVPSPVFNTKQETDTSYNKAIELCMQNLDVVDLCVATHNVESVLLAVDLMDRLGIVKKNGRRVWFAQLMGMADFLSFPLAQEGLQCAKFIPVGRVEEAMPYLIRRLEENSGIHQQMARELKNTCRALLRRFIGF